jgi:hypothetical protein
LLVYLVRQTGGSRLVVSDYTVFDRDARHQALPLEYTEPVRADAVFFCIL